MRRRSQPEPMDPLGPLCPSCRRPLHKGLTCYEVAERERMGSSYYDGDPCPVCHRKHPPGDCPMRTPEEVEEYKALRGRMSYSSR